MLSHLRAALKVLSSFSLIERDNDDLIHIHPLMHAWTRDRLNELHKEKVWTRTVSTVALSIPSIVENPNYQYRRSLVPHVDACLSGWNDGVLNLFDIGEDGPKMAAKFALVYRAMGRWQEAMQLTKQAVDANKEVLGDMHPSTLTSMHDLGINYSKAVRPQEALQLHENVVEARTKTFGQEHPDTLRSMHALSNTYAQTNKKQEALQLIQQMDVPRKKRLGGQHADTLHSLLSLANHCADLGKKQTALEMMQELAEGHKSILGQEHPNALNSMHNLTIRHSETGHDQQPYR